MIYDPIPDVRQCLSTATYACLMLNLYNVFIYLLHTLQWYVTPQSSSYYTYDEQYRLINAYKEIIYVRIDTFW